MANIIPEVFTPGRALQNGSTLNNIINRLNNVLNGVTTVPSLKVTNLSATGWSQVSVANALTAAGTTRADALVLTAANNFISTAAASTGAVLPSAATVGIGGEVIIFNGGASAIKVYGAGSDTIDGTAGATGVTLTNAKRCVYFVNAAATWNSAQLGVVSA